MNKNNNRLVLTLKGQGENLRFFLKTLKSNPVYTLSNVLPLYATSQSSLINDVWTNLNNLNKKVSVCSVINKGVGVGFDGCSKSTKSLNSKGFLNKVLRWFK